MPLDTVGEAEDRQVTDVVLRLAGQCVAFRHSASMDIRPNAPDGVVQQRRDVLAALHSLVPTDGGGDLDVGRLHRGIRQHPAQPGQRHGVRVDRAGGEQRRRQEGDEPRGRDHGPVGAHALQAHPPCGERREQAVRSSAGGFS